MNLELQNHLNSMCCSSEVLPNGDSLLPNELVIAGNFQYNFDSLQPFQKPTDAELIAYDSAMVANDSTFRTLRDAYSQSQVNYIINQSIGRISDFDISTVTCRPDAIGILPAKANFFNIPYIQATKTSVYGFPYDATFLTEVQSFANLPTLNNKGDIRYVIDETEEYIWNGTAWINLYTYGLTEEVNGELIDVVDLLNLSRMYRDAHLKSLNELLLTTATFAWPNNYLPTFQIKTYK